LLLRGSDSWQKRKTAQRVLMSRDDMKLRGTHNVENVLPRIARWSGGAAHRPIRCAKRSVSFTPVEHR
jgi:UDP-N-acetylmuramoylalanine-D-glutamate ligase